MHKPFLTAAGAVLALTAPLFAGGFWTVLGNPEASPEARAMHAVLTVKLAGCHEPEKAGVTARAIGVVNGERREIPLKLSSLAPGFYGLAQQWPAEGRWVIEIVAVNGGAVTSALVPAGPRGVDREHARIGAGRPDSGALSALLNGAPAAEMARK